MTTQASENKLRLLELEKEGGFVFHGSGVALDSLEPRQAYNFENEKQEPDGVPAVYASGKADYAIFMALINEINCPSGYESSSGTIDGKLVFRASKDTLSQLSENASGWVYVFKKDQFQQRDRDGVEFISTQSVTPLEQIQVRKEDLPQDIEVFNTPSNFGKRIAVVGVSASGKSTFARKLAEKTKLPLFLMDSIMWNPGWQYVGDEKTVEKLHEIGSQEEWILEGYIDKKARPFIFERADTIIYLDYPPIVATLRYLQRWLKHRKNPRPELEGSPEKFDWKFMKLVWKKGEAVSLNKFLNQISNQNKIIKLTSVQQTKKFLKSI
mgnify:FL=1